MDLDPTLVYLLLGSNLGDSKAILQQAVDLIAKNVGEIAAASNIYETAAWGKTDQPNFLNQAVIVSSTLEPLALLTTILAIEQDLGRVRKERWGARLIDIDIIFYGDAIINIAGKLQVPHPEMQNRKFVLEPLASLAPNFIHPILKQNLSTILLNLKDPLAVKSRN
jgi:2-amino-4-hydroxy-6-hydroxymethyldihydropteridine diphosphokinase